MARETINFNVESVNPGGAVSIVAGAVVNVYVQNNDGSQGALATIFAAPTGVDEIIQPLISNALGRIPGYLEGGTYLINVVSGLLDDTISYTVGGPPGAPGPQGVPGAQGPGGGLTNAVIPATMGRNANSNELILADATSGPFSITLPTPSAGSLVIIKKTDSSANAITIVGTIDGQVNATLVNQAQAVLVEADGAAWHRVVRQSLADTVDYPSTSDSRYTRQSNNLSDLGSASTARTNLGLGSAATQSDAGYEHTTSKGQPSGYMGLDSGGRGAQPPAAHAATHAPGSSDPLTIADLPTSVAPLASPNFTGTPTAPTPPPGDNSIRLATTAFVLSAGQPFQIIAPSGDATGITDDTHFNAALSALPNGGIIYLLGNANVPFRTKTGWVPPVQTLSGTTGGGPVSIQGVGKPVLMPIGGVTGIFYHRTSDYDTPSINNPSAGSIKDVVIDGSLATAASVSNLVLNPSFEYDGGGNTPADWGSQITVTSTLVTWQAQTGWAAPGSTVSGRLTVTINSVNGAYSKIGATGTAGIPVTGGATYQLRAQTNTLALGAGFALVGVRWYDSTGATISTVTPTGCATGVGNLGVFQLSGTTVAPSNAAFAAVRIGFSSNAGTGTNDAYFDNVMFSQSSTVLPYSDGDSVGWTWTGAAGDSVSAPLSVGLDVGDGDGFDIDVVTQNFQGPGSVGTFLANRIFTTSHSRLKIHAYRNTTNVLMDAIGGGDFFYNDIEVHLRTNSNQAGVVVGGANINGGHLRIQGSMPVTSAASGAPTGNVAMLSLLNQSKVFGTRIEAHVEQNSSATGTIWPWALYSDSTGVIQECEGYIDTNLNGSNMNGAECSMRGWYALTQAPGWPSTAFPGFNNRWVNQGPDAIVVVSQVAGTTSIGLNLVSLGSVTSGVFPVKAGGSIKVNGSGTVPSFTVVPDGVITEGAPIITGPTGAALFGNSGNFALSAFGCTGADTTLNLCTAAAMDHLLFGASSSTKMGRQLQKIYLTPGNTTAGAAADLPTTPSQVWPLITAFMSQGGYVFISFRPTNNQLNGSAVQFSTALDNAFAACVDGCVSALPAGHWKACLWQEMNQNAFTGVGKVDIHGNSISSQFPFPQGATDYHKYVAHYGPIFRTHAPGVPLVYDPEVATGGNSSGSPGAVSYCPNPTWVDEVAVDYYATSFNGGQKIDSVAHMADTMAAPASVTVPGGGAVPFSVAEWGLRASAFNPGATVWNNYISYLTTLFQTRRNTSKTNGWMIYFSGKSGAPTPAVDGSDNGWSTTGDFKLPGILSFYTAIGT